MAKLEAVGAVLVVAALFAGASAAVPGPNDLRYPDYIVKPPVQCSVEGSFHHPRNCSWYYRCVDRMKIGYFHVFHFECEPGTVFSDDLDQCVFPHLVEPPCGSAGQGPVTPTTPPKPEPCIFYDQDCKTEKLCYPSEERVFCDRCRRGSTTVTAAAFCGGAGLVFDKGLGRCVAIPTESRKCPPPTPTPDTSTSVNCVFNASVCEERELCQPEETVTLCRHCYFGNTLIDYCGQSKGMIYDLDLKKCVAEPDATRQCQASSPTGSLTCSFDDSVCEKRVLCNPSETKTLCRQCYIGETLIDYCGQSKGLIYDLDLNQCVEEPGDSRVCGASVSGENTVQCSDGNTRPGHDWIKRFYCSRYNLCGPNNAFKEAVSLCTNYYQCYKNPDGSWYVEKRNCVGNKLYSFDSDSCEDEPSEDQLCTF